MKDFERIDQLIKDMDSLDRAIVSQVDRLKAYAEIVVDIPTLNIMTNIFRFSLMMIIFEKEGVKKKTELDKEWHDTLIQPEKPESQKRTPK